jgi:heme A synthase
VIGGSLIEFISHLPIALILFSAAVWTFLIAWRNPQRLKQSVRQRLMSVVSESLVCALLCSLILALFDQRWIGSILWDGLRGGILWGVCAYYSRTQYFKIMSRENNKTHQNVVKDDLT